MAGSGQTGAQHTCKVEAWQSDDLAGLLCRGLVKQLSSKPAEQGSGRPAGRGLSRVEIQQACVTGAWWSGGPVGLWGGGPAEQTSSRPVEQGLGL
jgi:hypothetical protein